MKNTLINFMHSIIQLPNTIYCSQVTFKYCFLLTLKSVFSLIVASARVQECFDLFVLLLLFLSLFLSLLTEIDIKPILQVRLQ